MQGRKLGQVIINTLQDIGAAMGCYKIILDCSRDNIRGLHLTVELGRLTRIRFAQRSTRSVGKSSQAYFGNVTDARC